MRSLGKTTWRTRAATATAAAAVGAAAVLGPGGADAAPLFSNPWETLGLDQIVGLLGDPSVQKYVGDSCRSGAERVSAGGVTVDCSRSTGNGTAVVLPGSIDLAKNDHVTYDFNGVKTEVELQGQLSGNTVTIDADLGSRNLIEMAGAATNDPWFDLINPLDLLQGWNTYDEVVTAAALAPDLTTTDVCVFPDGTEYERKCITFWETTLLGAVNVPKGTDRNLAARTRALDIAAYLSDRTFTADDYAYGVDLTQPSVGPSAAEGSATVVGDGIQLALAMTGGTARADSYLPWSIATAGASQNRAAHAQSIIGISNALNTDELGLTWFGAPLNLQKALHLLDVADRDDLIALGDTHIPAFKEVSCFGVYTRASADGLGSCTNVLGTFDYYRDHASGQRQFALTDVTSLFLGGDQALVSQLNDPESEFMSGLLRNLTQADSRLKFAKDFIRFTTAPVTDPETGKTHTAYWLTSDYGLTAPIVVELAGYQLTFFPGETVNGAYRPNLIGLPQLKALGADAERGLLPKVSLIAWANPFGLGTLSLDEPLNPLRTVTDYARSVTVAEDLENLSAVADLVGDGWAAREANRAPSPETAVSAEPEIDVPTASETEPEARTAASQFDVSGPTRDAAGPSGTTDGTAGTDTTRTGTTDTDTDTEVGTGTTDADTAPADLGDA